MVRQISGRPGVRSLLLGVLAVIVVWFVLGAVHLFQLRSESKDLRGDLHALRFEAKGIQRSLDGGKEVDLDRAEDQLSEVVASARDLHDGLDSPLLLPYQVVPGLSRQVDSARSITAASLDLATAGQAVLRGVREVESSGDPGSRSAGYRRLAAGALALRDAVRADLGPRSFLVPSLRKDRAEAAKVLDQVSEPAGAMAGTVPGAVDFLTGPRNYLLLSANNTESAGFSGRYLQAGWLRVRDGDVRVDALRETNEASEIIKPGTVPMTDADWTRNWGWLQPSSLFTELGTTSRFPVTASTAAQMWAARTGRSVDGVMSIDIDALVGVVRATGGVEFQGKDMSADEVERYLLVDQYRDKDNQARRQRLAVLTDAVLGTLQSPENTDVVALVRALREAVAGRHLMLWSANAVDQDVWRALGADGQPAGDSIQIGTSTLMSKLDHFLDIDVTGRQRVAGDGRLAQLDITIRNRATGSEPEYLLASPQYLGRTPGTYAGFLLVDLPQGAQRVAIDGPANVNGPDGEQVQVSTFVELPPQGTRTVRVRFRLPGPQDVGVTPSARIPSIRWKLGDEERSDARAFSTELDSWAPLRGPGPAYVTKAQARQRLEQINAGLGPLAAVDVDSFAAMVVTRTAATGPSILKDAALSGIELPDFMTILQLLSQKRFLEQQVG